MSAAAWLVAKRLSRHVLYQHDNKSGDESAVFSARITVEGGIWGDSDGTNKYHCISEGLLHVGLRIWEGIIALQGTRTETLVP